MGNTELYNYCVEEQIQFMYLEGSAHEDVEGGLELETVLEEVHAREYVEAEARPRHGHHQATHVPQVTNVVCPENRKEMKFMKEGI